MSLVAVVLEGQPLRPAKSPSLPGTGGGARLPAIVDRGWLNVSKLRPDNQRKPYISRASRLERAIARLEGWAFGRWLEFNTLGWGDQLNIAIGEWKDIDGFRELPGLQELAKDLNKAMEPILKAYADRLRRELAAECLLVADQALEDN